MSLHQDPSEFAIERLLFQHQNSGLRVSIIRKGNGFCHRRWAVLRRDEHDTCTMPRFSRWPAKHCRLFWNCKECIQRKSHTKKNCQQSASLRHQATFILGVIKVCFAWHTWRTAFSNWDPDKPLQAGTLCPDRREGEVLAPLFPVELPSSSRLFFGPDVLQTSDRLWTG